MDESTPFINLWGVDTWQLSMIDLLPVKSDERRKDDLNDSLLWSLPRSKSDFNFFVGEIIFKSIWGCVGGRGPSVEDTPPPKYYWYKI